MVAIEDGRIIADTIVYNGRIVTVDGQNTVAEAIAILGGRIVAVGSDADVKRLAGAGTRRVDLSGATAIPGMIDNHTHQTLGGLDHREVGAKIDITQCKSIAEIKATIKDAAARVEPGQWLCTSLMFRGALAEGRFPNRHDLDEVAPDNPVYIFQSGKNVFVNSMALRLAEIDRSTADPPHDPNVAEGKIMHDEAGEPTGHLIGGAADMARMRWWTLLGMPIKKWDFLTYDHETYISAIIAQMKSFNAVGITGTRDMGLSPNELDAYVDVMRRGEITVRTDLILGLPGRYLPIAELKQALMSYFGPKQHLGNEWLRLGALKIAIQNDGFWAYSPEKLRTMLVEGNRLGWTFAIHGTSGSTEGGMELVISVLEEADRIRPLNGRRWTFEHGIGLIDPDHYQRLKALGVIVAANPPLSYYAAARSLKMNSTMEQVMAEGAAKGDPWQKTVNEWGLPLKSWHDAGLIVTGGTDYPASQYDPEQPLFPLWVACTQQSLVGALMPEEVVTREQALRMWTVNSAYATFSEHERGTLEVGKLADLVVLSADPLTVSDDELLEIKVLETIVGGNTVYKRG